METILVVDDEPEVLAVAVDMLQAKGYTILQTGDPLEALRIARTETGPIHLLLSDVVMPLMNGRELWKALLPAGAQATPMTCEVGGRQYVLISSGGHTASWGLPGEVSNTDG